MLDIAYVGGAYLPIAEAKVSLEDRAYQFGDGVYEALLAFDHKPFALREHLDRWNRSCAALRLTCPYDRQQIEKNFHGRGLYGVGTVSGSASD